MKGDLPTLILLCIFMIRKLTIGLPQILNKVDHISIGYHNVWYLNRYGGIVKYHICVL